MNQDPAYLSSTATCRPQPPWWMRSQTILEALEDASTLENRGKKKGVGAARLRPPSVASLAVTLPLYRAGLSGPAS